jgi:hypothetical protein
VLLWTLLGEAGGIDDPTKGAELRHTISITGRDGHVVIISTGEIAPDFGGIARERPGQSRRNVIGLHVGAQHEAVRGERRPDLAHRCFRSAVALDMGAARRDRQHERQRFEHQRVAGRP